MYSVLKQRCLLAIVLSIEECIFLVEYVFQEGSRYTDLVQEQFAEKFPETPVFANKIKWIQAC
jgi:hypothetical protein